MVKGIIFDLDGTLISEREYVLGCLKHTADYLERTYGTQDAYVKLKKLFETKWESIFDRYFEWENIPYKTIDIQNLIQIYWETEPVTWPYEDVDECLRSLKKKGIKLALLTNGYYSVQKKKVDAAGLEPLFDLIVIPDEKGREYWKPNRWAYDYILQTFGIRPDEAMAIGDMDHDFIVPKAVGIQCVYIRREDRIKDLNQKMEFVRRIDSLKEIEMEV